METLLWLFEIDSHELLGGADDSVYPLVTHAVVRVYLGSYLCHLLPSTTYHSHRHGTDFHESNSNFHDATFL